MRDSGRRFDTIGYWSEVKLDIVREYAKAYSTVIAAQTGVEFYHLYVDGFAGAGVHISRTTGEGVLGSPLNALAVEPKFREYHFIDLDSSKVVLLRERVGDRPNVHIWEGDCNRILLDEVLPRCRYSERHRALWLLDPYGLDLDWDVLAAAGRRSPSRFS